MKTYELDFVEIGKDVFHKNRNIVVGQYVTIQIQISYSLFTT